jgi:hypothetical protein
MSVDPAYGDQWAWTGRTFGDHPINPIGPDFGAIAFGTGSGMGGAAVTDHGTHTDSGGGYLDLNTESLQNVAYATTGQGSFVSSYEPKGPTPFQQALMDGVTYGYGY